jgi:DNA excision repair protein ERCC-3
MPPTDNNDAQDEYTSARKLVQRATLREKALSAKGASGSGGGSSSSSLVAIGGGADFSNMPLKADHIQRPVWTCPDGNIYLEAFHDLYVQAYDFLVAIAEPVARPEFIHQYKLTPYSLYAAVATNISTNSIVSVLERLSKNKLPSSVEKFIRDCTAKYGKAKLVLKHNKFYVESDFPEVLRELLRDPTIAQARVVEDATSTKDADGFLTTNKAEEMKENLHILKEPGDDEDDSEGEDGGGANRPATIAKTVAFQIKGEAVGQVKRQAIELDYPLSKCSDVHML